MKFIKTTSAPKNDAIVNMEHRPPWEYTSRRNILKCMSPGDEGSTPGRTTEATKARKATNLKKARKITPSQSSCNDPILARSLFKTSKWDWDIDLRVWLGFNIFIMQPIKEEPTLPRFTKEFIGIGHQLEQKRKDRRRYEQEERVVANRVLFLEK